MSSYVKSGQSNLPIKYYIFMTEKPAEYSFVGLLTVLCDDGICNEAANIVTRQSWRTIVKYLSL